VPGEHGRAASTVSLGDHAGDATPAGPRAPCGIVTGANFDFGGERGFAAPKGHEMHFEFTPPQTEIERLFGGHYYVNAYGAIDVGDDRKFIRFLEKSEVPARSTIYINSTGGDVDAAIGIGRAIRDGWHSTQIGQLLLGASGGDLLVAPRVLSPGVCMSAATLIYIGGRLRHYIDGSRFGVHQFLFRDPSPNDVPRSQMLSTRIAGYVRDMGISHEFLDLSASTPSEQINLITQERLKALGIITGGVTDVEWTVQSRGGAIYVRGERDTIFGHQKLMLGSGGPGKRYFHAVVESQGREEELTKFPLVEIVVNDEERFIDISSKCLRQVIGIYTNVFCDLELEEFEDLAASKSFGIYIRSSKSAEIFFGIAPISTSGAEDLIGSFVKNLG